MKWNNEEEILLRELYPVSDKTKILLNINRNWNAIVQKAFALGVKREVIVQRNGDISVLLDDTPTAYYWCGFIMADGTISHEYMRLSMSLSSKDRAHINTLAEFIKTNVKDRYVNAFGGIFQQCHISVQDNKKIVQLIDKFGFKKNKTNNPPDDITWMSDKLFISFFAGLIDGDGSIAKFQNRPDAFITIKMHSSWFHILEQIRRRLETIFGISIPAVKNYKYAKLTLSNIKLLRNLKNRVIELKIPFMYRKWRNIDTNIVSRYETAKERREITKNMLNEGFNQKDIATELGITKAGVSLMISRNLI